MQILQTHSETEGSTLEAEEKDDKQSRSTEEAGSDMRVAGDKEDEEECEGKLDDEDEKDDA